MTFRIQIGSWSCPSGDSVDVFLRYDASGLAHGDLEWDEPPPLLPEDDAYYTAVILPGIAQCIADMQAYPAGQALLDRARATS
jgi:hypothetical protein